MRLSKDGGVVWGLGMYASGSTWLFNAMIQVADAIAPDLPRLSRFVAAASDVGDLRPARQLLLIKSHETDVAADSALTAAAHLVVVTIRDPLDVVASAIRYQRCDFDKALRLTEASALQCARYFGDRRTLLLRYEAAFVDDPATLDRLAARLGGSMALADRSRIFRASRRHEVERQIAALSGRPGVLVDRLSGDLLDPATQWHSHHANRSGEVGRWQRTLDAGQVAEVQARMGGWMSESYYPTDRVLEKDRVGVL